MKLVIFKLGDGSVAGINPDQVCAVVPAEPRRDDGRERTDIVTTARALTYRVEEPIGSVIHRLEQRLDIEFAEPA